MLLGFKRRFAPFVEDGSKTHTIRAIRKNPPRVGETCHCYVDPRQKTMRLLGRFECVKVEEIEIRREGFGRRMGFLWKFVIDGISLSTDEMNALAWRDGFRSSEYDNAWAEMADYWIRMHGSGNKPFVFCGHVIHWRYKPALTTTQPRSDRRETVARPMRRTGRLSPASRSNA